MAELEVVTKEEGNRLARACEVAARQWRGGHPMGHDAILELHRALKQVAPPLSRAALDWVATEHEMNSLKEENERLREAGNQILERLEIVSGWSGPIACSEVEGELEDGVSMLRAVLSPPQKAPDAPPEPTA